VKVLEDNNELLQKTRNHGFVSREFFSFNTSEGVLLNGWMMKPADFDPEKKYPVFMYTYGGPGSQTVVDRWDAFNGVWYQMLTQMGCIVVSVDNRGTGARGEEFKKMTYLQLGKYETIDQIEAAKYLGQLPYVDNKRISIFGWSYGGYLSSLCLAKGADYFAAAIAVAPVTNWRFYDTIYTERYMRTPKENPQGYDDNSPINHVEKIKGAFLLVHGSADDNVHYQNTMEMTHALIDANIPFELAIYPNYNHGIAGGNARLHLYEHMTRFLKANFLSE
jgi:dipeptidyl-peptidase-4